MEAYFLTAVGSPHLGNSGSNISTLILEGVSDKRPGNKRARELFFNKIYDYEQHL
jgi:hypothetical protein